MKKGKPFEVAVISDNSYENLVAEVKFTSKDVGLILSQEKSFEKIDISVFSFISDGENKFLDTDNIPEISIDLNVFLAAIDEAVQRLRLLDVPR
ncbi:hypothetical protein EJ066_06870 [Mesorhizobium sp. M9A.F.Ca.ET.002.03.1.2]|uniref:hypothetical protein n=1 Tax=Mesorhizobium sp. M9A.F.Ca.ET.002.03.1.2 TaxID=2493668 RepID=UPI000F7659AF|nr:hypothetical protein [Mesorhizobium sp. M9A.F.Ca.ET.002.03.1.2]AZN97033.1 hypothetical protein EJ066_06870 [Mesorhizobium sp. M9A.F.Ca.ET.002.03.1.2]